MLNFQAKTFCLFVFGHRHLIGCKIQIFWRRPLFLVRWNYGGPLESCCAWHGFWDEKVSDPCPYFWVHGNGSPGYVEGGLWYRVCFLN